MTEKPDEDAKTVAERAVQAAEVAVHEARAVLAQWAAREVEATDELARVEATSGEAYLSDPAALEEVPKLLRELRDRIGIAQTAQQAQGPRVREAESAWLAAQADLHEVPVLEIEARLEAHNAKTERLLAALVKHDGPYVTEQELARVRNDLRPYVAGLPDSWTIPTSEVISNEAREGRRDVWVLRELAAGRDPLAPQAGAWWGATSDVPAHEFFPACVWSPDSLVPVALYVETRERHQNLMDQYRESLAERRRQVNQLEARIAAGETVSTEVVGIGLGRTPSLEAQLAEAVMARDSVAASMERQERQSIQVLGEGAVS